MTLRTRDREDGNLVIHDDDESPDAWMVVDPEMIMVDTDLATRRHTTVNDWSPYDDRHSEPQTDVNDWELKD